MSDIDAPLQHRVDLLQAAHQLDETARRAEAEAEHLRALAWRDCPRDLVTALLHAYNERTPESTHENNPHRVQLADYRTPPGHITAYCTGCEWTTTAHMTEATAQAVRHLTTNR